MKIRAQLNHSLTDVNFRNKPKIKTMSLKFGHLARCWLRDLIDDLSGATNATVDRDLAIGIALEIGITNAEELIDYCLDKGILVSESPGTISNSRVIEDQESLGEQQQKWREKKRGQRGGVPGDNMGDKVGDNHGTSVGTLNVHESEHTEQLNNIINNGPTSETLPPVDSSDPYAIKARDSLEAPSGQPWTGSNAFINEGRRPMKKFPKILLRENDLARILREIEDAGVPRNQVQKVFQAATDRITAQERNGKRFDGLAVEAWLTSFCLTDTVELLKKSQQLKQTTERGSHEQRR